jgi:hypothetical protein
MPPIDLTAVSDEALADQHQYVFVVTFGRTGSTLVQGLLNALPRTLVRGENGMFVLHQWRASQAAVTFGTNHIRHRPRQSSSAFFGVHLLTTESFIRSTRALVKQLLLGRHGPGSVDRLGFKEVRWHEIDPEETEAFFGWFDQVFPGAKYVLNTRDREQAVGSGFWQRSDRTEAMNKIDRVMEVQEFLRTTRPGRCLDTRYEEITSEDATVSDKALVRLGTFVTGEPCDRALLEDLRAVLATGHGPKPFGESREQSAGEATA